MFLTASTCYATIEVLPVLIFLFQASSGPGVNMSVGRVLGVQDAPTAVTAGM